MEEENQRPNTENFEVNDQLNRIIRSSLVLSLDAEDEITEIYEDDLVNEYDYEIDYGIEIIGNNINAEEIIHDYYNSFNDPERLRNPTKIIKSNLKVLVMRREEVCVICLDDSTTVGFSHDDMLHVVCCKECAEKLPNLCPLCNVDCSFKTFVTQ